ncbi:hypothetical protein P692DRAFT_20761276, partial [Suillus brevipes Sb2]
MNDDTYLYESAVYARTHGRSARTYFIIVTGIFGCLSSGILGGIWVRGDEPMYVDVDNTELLARGTLFPNQDMDAVDAMIAKGMKMTRECLATVYQKVTPGSDITALGDSSVALSHNWD